MSDKKHRELQNAYVKFIKDDDIIYCEVEKEFNNYGQRGFIDILILENDKKKHWLNLIEIKIKIDDVGDFIRKLKKAINNLGIIRLNDYNYTLTNYVEIIVPKGFKVKELLVENKYLFENCGLDIAFLEFDIEKEQIEKCYYVENGKIPPFRGK